MSVRGGRLYEYKNGAHEISSEWKDHAFRMARLGRQAGVECKKLPPLGVRVDFAQPWPIGHPAAHPGGLALGVAPRLLLGGGERFRERGFAPQMGREPADADRLHGLQIRIEVAAGCGAD